MNPIVRKFLQKQLFNQKGAIASGKSVKFSYDALETRMKNLGLDINLIKSEKDLKQALGFVKNMEDQIFQKEFGNVLNKKETAKVFDLEGKRLDPNKPIMGGTQEESIKKNIAEATEKGDFKGIFNQVLRDPDIAREFALSKKFPFRRDINVRSGEDAIPLARAAKFDEEMKKLNVSATPGKDAENTVGEFVDQMKKFGVKDKDIQMMLGSGKSGQVPYVMEQYGLSASDVVNLLKEGKPLIEGMAKGGRAGFKVGSPSKRAFLKIMGGLAATITALKSGLIGTPKKEVAKQVVKESVKDVSSAPPNYFFDLAKKIKKLGKESEVKPQERVNEYNYKGKDGSDYTLTEDITTGDMQIVKEKGGIGIADDKTFDTIQDRTVMDYKAPKQDIDPDTEKILKEGAEYDEYRVNFDRDGKPADADDIDEIIKKEIIDEASDVPQKKIKRAGGGVAYMLGE